jgi:DNA topoisomerase-1
MLIIVESPAKAKTISQIVGKDHTVKASVGHIRGLSKDKKNSKGDKLEIAGIDIDNNFAPLYQVDEEKKKVVTELKKLAKAAKDGILFATDADREGESISWHLAEVLGIKDKSKVRRLEFHEITKKAIQDAIANPRDLNMMLVSAQQARQVLDKLVGFKLSPVLWTAMGNRKLSAGRVQTPALALICQREHEIINFVPEDFWNVEGDFAEKDGGKPTITTVREDDEKEAKESRNFLNEISLYAHNGEKVGEKISDKKVISGIQTSLVDHYTFSVASSAIKKETSKTKPPFITSSLQQAASNKLGMTPRQTMQIAQKLYEGIPIDGKNQALITYMRTDSYNLSEESLVAARKYISLKFDQYLPKESKKYTSKSRNAQEAHEAIRPTDPLRTPESLRGKLDPKFLKLYTLIWKQMIASQMTDEVRERLSFSLINEVNDEFRGSVAWTIHDGFKALLDPDSLQKQSYSLEVGTTLYLDTVSIYEKQTQPPSRYTPASLISKLESLGIGRPSTYASIISTLQDRNYVEMEKRSMKPTTLGLKVGDLLIENFDSVTSSELTAYMESELDAVSRGEKEYEEVLTKFWGPFKKQVEQQTKEIQENRSKYNTSETDEKCPICGSEMELKLGRFGEYLQCTTHKEHMFAKNYKEVAAALAKAHEEFDDQAKGQTCEECGKDLIVRVSKSSLNPYIACPDYRVGNKHTVKPVNYGPCPKCEKEGRSGDKQGVLVKKKSKFKKAFIGCNLPADTCGYIQKNDEQKETE